MKSVNAANLEQPLVELEPTSRNSRDFFRIASVSTAIGFGCAAGSLQALHWNAAKLSFQISVWTFVAFIIGAVVALLYWKAATSSAASARKGSFLLALVGVGLFLYPLRFVPAEKRFDIGVGLGLATMALSTVAFMLWQVKRYLDRDSKDFETTPK